jgi:hypothetical protein
MGKKIFLQASEGLYRHFFVLNPPLRPVEKIFLSHGHLGLALLFIFDELSGPSGLFEQRS